MWAVRETFHKGALPTVFEGVSVSATNVSVSAIKEQEDGRGYILRLYELDGIDTDVTVRLFDRETTVHVPHNGIKTLWFDENDVIETDFIEAF